MLIVIATEPNIVTIGIKNTIFVRMKSWKSTFMIIWTGQAMSLLTSSIVQFAIIWWITIEMGSAKSLAIASIAGIMPQIILGPFIGVWIDRLDRKRIMIVSDLGIAFFTLILGALFHFGVVEIWHIYILLAIRSVGSSFHYPAMQASTPLLAPESQLTRIAGINQTLYSIANIAGPAIGAIVCQALSMQYIVLIDILGAVWACGALLFVTIPKPPPIEQHGKVLKELAATFRVLYSHKGLLAMLTAWLVAIFFFVPTDTLFPLMTISYFGGDAYQMSMIEVAFGIGMLIGGTAMGIWGSNKGRVKLFTWGMIALGMCYLLSGFLMPHQFVLFAILVFAMGLAVPVLNSPTNSLLQSHIPSGMLGRVFSLIDTLILLPVPFGLLMVGTVSDAIGIEKIFLIAGIAIVSVGVACFFIKPLQTLDKE